VAVSRSLDELVPVWMRTINFYSNSIGSSPLRCDQGLQR